MTLESKGLILMTAYCWRFHDTIARTKEWLDSGAAGRVLMFRLRFGGYVDMAGRWFGEHDKGGGVVKESSIHSIDLFRWLVGEVANVSGRAATLNTGISAEESAIYLLESADGALGVIEGSWATPRSENRLEVYCADGAAVVNVNEGKATLRPRSGEMIYLENQGPDGHRFDREAAHFVDCLCGVAEPIISGYDGLRAVEVADAVLLSIASRRWVEL